MKRLIPGIILAGMIILISGCNRPAEAEPCNDIAADIAPGSAPAREAIEPFFGVSSELAGELEQIVLSDARVQEILEDRSSIYTVNGYTIRDKDYNIAVGVRLNDDITQDKFQEWVRSGRHDSDLIKEYVGVISVGYNGRYYIVIDKEKQELLEITQEQGSGSIPELTTDDKKRAIEIALADATVQQILEGKQVQIAPEGRIGVWHEGTEKLGAIFEINFDEPCFISFEFSRPDGKPYLFSGEVKIIVINVLFEDNRVESITPLTGVNR